MIDTRAISAITTVLHNRLERGLSEAVPGTQVSMRPPDKVRVNAGFVLNLFLFRVEPDSAWRNAMLSSEADERGPVRAVLALKLYYMLTVYGPDDDAGPACHGLLCEGIRLLEQQPQLRACEVESALRGVQLSLPARPVELTPHTISSEEMSKLWGMFQVPYRLSVVYAVSVVLADRTAPVNER